MITIHPRPAELDRDFEKLAAWSNKPMIVIDQKPGYVLLPGTYRMEKVLN
jgi:hypothetical protein